MKLFLSLLLVLGFGWSQGFQAQIGGTVTDSAGAAVPNAKVIATSVTTGVEYNARTNNEGLYRLLALPPAQYRVSVTLPGFKTFDQGPITLNVNDALTLNITMQVGDVSEQVTVNAAPPALQTETATLGTVVSQRSIENLPLNVRDPLALIGLTPGVTFGGNFGNGGGTDVGRNFFKSDFNVGGGRSGSQEILIDGAPDTTPDTNFGIIDPPVDSVQEFRLQSQSFDAEFGRTTGGIVNLITKSGTNEYHGTAYDFLRNSIFDANDFFNNRAGAPNPSFKRNQFGGNAGGPVFKNRTFAFGDYEGLRQGFPSTRISTVPTTAQRAGDFSQTFTNVNGSPALIQIYDPASLTVVNGVRTRSLFAGNKIPSDRFDPVAKNVLSYLPLPNTTGDPITGQNNYIFGAKSITNSDKWDVRADENFTDNTRAFLRLSHQTDVRLTPGNLPPPAGGGRNTTDVFSQGVVDLTHVFSARWIGTMQFSASRAQGTQFGLSYGFNVSSLGFPASFATASAPQFPVLNMTDTASTQNSGGIGGSGDAIVQFQPRNVFVWHGGFAYSRGKHNMKFGAEYRMLDFNEGQNNFSSGMFNFDRTFTQGPVPTTASRTAGFGFADFLLGDVTSGTIRKLNTISTRGNYTALYFQDDWKVSNKLTLNLGLRYDLERGSNEKYGRLASFDPGATSTLGAQVGLPNLKGALRWIDVNGNDSYTQATNYLNFAPRAGFAYQVRPSFVIRGGYGMFFVPRIDKGNSGGAVEAFRDTALNGTVDGVTPANKLSNPYPQGVLPPINDGNPLANIGSTIAAPTHDFKSGYVQQRNIGFQWETPGQFIVSGYYWGSKGTHLLSGPFNINQLPDQYLALGTTLNDQVPNPFRGVITTGPLSGATISRRQSLLPFPQYVGDSGVQQVYVPNGNSSYNAGTVQVERRLRTLTLLVSYTRSKAIDDMQSTTALDYYNHKLLKSLSAFDTPNQFIGSMVYPLPFGRNRHFGPDWNRTLNFVLGDWDLDAIARLQSGTPIGLSLPATNNGRSGHTDNPTLGRWFNTGVFSVAAPFTFGNVGPRLPDVRTDWVQNLDAVLVKNFETGIRDHAIRTQFRAEVFNLLNTPNFSAPNTNVSSGSFGVVSSQFNKPREIQLALKISF